MSLQDRRPSRRILAAFGEPEEFFGFTLADLKLLLPALFTGLIIGGNTPAAIQPAGWLLGGALVVASLIVIYAAPDHQTATAWLWEKVRYSLTPSRFVLDATDERSSTADELHPTVESSDGSGESAVLSGEVALGDTESLTEFERFHLKADTGERADGYVFGALRVEPANMALATRDDWERVAEQFGAVVNGIEFPFQIYSRGTPVDPERITAGYRDRLDGDDLQATPAFRELVATYAQRFPDEFAQRGTGVREYYVVVPVSPLAVQTGGSRLGEDGLLAQLGELPYVGGFIRGFTAARSSTAHEETRTRQLAELDRRLNTLADGLRRIEGCRSDRLASEELAAVLDDFWTGSETLTTASTQPPRSSPVVTAGDDFDGGEMP
jgi:hypothetical protein